MTIDGVEIYSYSTGYSDFEEGTSSVSGNSDAYQLTIEDETLNCTLSAESLSCENEAIAVELSVGGEIQESFETLVETWPATPEYIKENCVDAAITTTGNALEWGGFEGADDNVSNYCYGYDADGNYSYIYSGEDFIFSFEAPNDGCFGFDTTGTDFHHAKL